MDVDRHRVDVAVNGQPIGEGLREDRLPTELLDDAVDGLDLFVVDIVGQLSTGVPLEGARRVAVLEVGSQLGLGVRARSARDGQILELVVRILLGEHLLEGVETLRLGAVGPPGEYADLAAGSACLRG